MREFFLFWLVMSFTLVIFAPEVLAQSQPPENGRGHRDPGTTNYFNVVVPAHDYDLILARPEKTSVTLSALAYRDMEGFVTYGTQSGDRTNQTPMRQFKTGLPVESVIGSLQPDTRYSCQFHYRPDGETKFSTSPDFSFSTARPAGSSFTFTMTADVHLDEHTSAAVYQQSLTNIRADAPDFPLISAICL